MSSRLCFCIFSFLLFEAAHSEAIHDLLIITNCDGKVGIDVKVNKDSEEERAFTKLLREVVKSYLQKEPEAVLNIGCGNGADTGAFKNAFQDTTEILGVDVNETEIEEARREFADVNIQFQHLDMADAAVLDDPKRYDVIVMRHPEPFPNYQAWENIFSNAKALARAGGLMVITTYARSEVDFFASRKEPSVFLAHHGRNPFFSGIIQHNVGRDLYYAVFGMMT